MSLPTLKTDVDYVLSVVPKTRFQPRIRTAFKKAGIDTLGQMYERAGFGSGKSGLLKLGNFGAQSWLKLNEALESLNLPNLEHAAAVIGKQTLEIDEIDPPRSRRNRDTRANFSDLLAEFLKCHGKKHDLDTVAIVLLITRPTHTA